MTGKVHHSIINVRGFSFPLDFKSSEAADYLLELMNDKNREICKLCSKILDIVAVSIICVYVEGCGGGEYPRPQERARGESLCSTKLHLVEILGSIFSIA